MFVNSDFKDMKIPLLEGVRKSEEQLKDLPELASYIRKEDSHTSTERISILNYILLMYDPSSPFVKKFHNINKRMKFVIDYLGIGEKTKIGKRLASYEDEDVVMMIDSFVKWLNNRLWGLIVVNESVFYEYQKELMESVSGKDSKDKLAALNTKQKILESIDEISTRLDGYYAQLYSGDSEIKKSIESSQITPERVASGILYADS